MAQFPEIPFNKPFLTGKEMEYIRSAVESEHISGNGAFTRKCHAFFESRYGLKKSLLTTSCTDALEMAALLANLSPGDEVIMPSFTFVSTANAFVLRGAKIVFADSEAATPNMDVAALEALITPRTRAIVPVHYAGVAVDMDPLLALAAKHNLIVIEDAAQAIESTYKGRALGSIGQLAAFSFHETKNIISGEGGMLAINDAAHIARAEVLWEKGTNRAAFYRGEVNKYGWMDMGSSFLPSDIIAAFLFAQLENLEHIQARRMALWERYRNHLSPLEAAGKLRLPSIPEYASNNAHIFYILCGSLEERTRLIRHMKDSNVHPVFHYLSLHASPFYAEKHDGRPLPLSDYYTDHLLRLPLYFNLKEEQVDFVCEKIHAFYAG